MVDISIIIPSYKDPYLYDTIWSIIDNFETDFEIIPVVDGYEPFEPLDFHPRIRPIFHKKNRGMREAINSGVRAAKGKYLMRSDEHCMFAEGFDRVILETIEDNWIVVGRRFFLDPERWIVMDDKPPIDFEKLVVIEKPDKGIMKFSAVSWKRRNKEMKDVMLAETMAMQGSCWVMPRSWWDGVISELQTEGYGPHYQDTTEMLFKTWRAGGKLMLNRNTWYAHRHRDFNRTHQYNTSKAIPEWQYALDTWHDDYQKIRKKWNV